MVTHFDYARAFCRLQWRPLMLLAVSCILAGVYLVGSPYIFYNDGDPLTYFRKAWFLLGRSGGIDIPSRGPGYPIWQMDLQYNAFRWVKPILFFLMLALGTPLIVIGIGGRFVAFLMTSYFASAAAWSLVLSAPGGDLRHEDIYAFMSLIVVVLGVAALPRLFRFARRSPANATFAD